MAKGRSLALGGFMIFLMSPIIIILEVPKNLHKIILVIVVWWLAKDQVIGTVSLGQMILYFGLIAVFFNALLKLIMSMLKGLAIVLTWGWSLKLICRLSLNNSFLGQAILRNDNNSELVSSLSSVLGGDFRRRFDRLVALYLDSGNETGHSRLSDYLKEDRIFS